MSQQMSPEQERGRDPFASFSHFLHFHFFTFFNEETHCMALLAQITSHYDPSRKRIESKKDPFQLSFDTFLLNLSRIIR